MKRHAITTLMISFFFLSILISPAAADESWSSWTGRNVKSYEREINQCKVGKLCTDWRIVTEGAKKKIMIKERNKTKKEIATCINRANDSFVRRLLKPSDDDKKLYRISKKLKKKKYRKMLQKAKKEYIDNVHECMSVEGKATKTFVNKCSRQSTTVYWTRVDKVAKAIIADGKKIEQKLK
jgi:hypothetical protein